MYSSLVLSAIVPAIIFIVKLLLFSFNISLLFGTFFQGKSVTILITSNYRHILLTNLILHCFLWMWQEMEVIRGELAALRAQSNLANSRSLSMPRTLNRPGPEQANSNPDRVKKLTKFFGDEPPLLRLFLKKLGYEVRFLHCCGLLIVCTQVR